MKSLLILLVVWLMVMVPAMAEPAHVVPACTSLAGDRVLLLASTDDPDVFVWNKRENLLDYAAGHLRGAIWVLARTLLASAGTPAVVVSCFPALVRVRFGYGDGGSIHDAVGVKLTGGPYRGRYGWVMSGDEINLRTQNQ